MRRSSLSLVFALAMSFASCSEPPTGPMVLTSLVMVQAILPSTVRQLVIEVSGPGIRPTLTVNVLVGADDVARDSLVVPAGSARRFVITAVDTAGMASHRADTTLALAPGPNPPLAIVLRPIGTPP